MRRCLISFVVVALAAATSVTAQTTTGPSPSQRAAYAAIIFTPAGAMPAVVRIRRASDSASRGDVSLRYGRYSIPNSPGTRNNVGVNGMFNLSRRLQAGATVGYRSCTCESSSMGSLDLAASLWRKEASGDIGGDSDVGLLVSAGMGKADSTDFTAYSLSLGLPIAISLPQPENSLLTLFFSPSLAYGVRKLNGVTEGAPLFIFAAGVGYTFQFGLGVHAAVHRIGIEDSPTQIGFAMSWRFGTK
jgi:hypothetical protein